MSQVVQRDSSIENTFCVSIFSIENTFFVSIRDLLRRICITGSTTTVVLTLSDCSIDLKCMYQW